MAGGMTSADHTPGFPFGDGAWQIVVDGNGYETIHGSDEDGRPDDLIAETFGDYANLIAAAPDMFEALELCRAAFEAQFGFAEAWPKVDAALAKARGK